MSNVHRSHDPSAARTPETGTPRAPLVGVIAGVVVCAGMGLWTLQRIGEAKTLQADVEAKRSAESERSLAQAREPARVSAVRPVAGQWHPRVELDGTLQGQHEASLGFKVSGRLSRVGVEVGDRVRAGALLGQLDPAEASAQARAAEAQVRAAEATLALAEDGEQRTLPLVQSGSFAEATGVQATRQRELALAQLDSARAQRALAIVGVSNHTLTAPFGGTITQAPTGIGAVVAPGQPLFSLVDTSKLKLSTTVSENDAGLLAPGIAVHIASERGEATGRVTAVLATLDPRTRRVPVIAEFDNPGPSEPLRAGAFVRAWVQAPEAIDVLRLPHGVLRPGSQDEVFLVTGKPPRLEARRIVFAVDRDGALLVRSGIRADDEIVLNPIPEAQTGDLVKPQLAGSTPAEAEAPPAPAAGAPTAAAVSEVDAP